MTHPPIQIVNDQDQSIGAAPLAEAYEKGLIHRVVFTFVEDPSGKILLQKRGLNMHTYPGCWDISSAGHVDEGESYETAAKRELYEELGLSGLDLKEIASFRGDETHKGQLLKRFKRVYRVSVSPSTQFKLDPEEVSEVKWMKLADIKQLIVNHPDQVASGLTTSLDYYQP